MKNIFKHLLFVTVVFIFLATSASLAFADSDTDTEISDENGEAKMYTIDFFDIDNNLVESKTFSEGSLIVPPEVSESPDYVWINTEDESDILTATSTVSKDACYYLVYLEEVVENATTFDLTPDSEKVFTYNGKDFYDTEATTTYTAGDNITAYWYESDGVLGFVGTGDMHDCETSIALWSDIKTSITDVYLSDEITSIGNFAFYNCTNLALSGELPSGLTSIGQQAFGNCTNLALTGSLPSGLTSIGNGAFANCKSLALSGELPSGLTTIGASAFRDCPNLALTGELPSGLITIGNYAFENCTNLALTGSLPSGLTSIGEHSFYGCTNLALTGELPSGLTSIGAYAFLGCPKLALTGSLPSGLTSIGRIVFYNVALEKTHFDKNLSSISITYNMYIPTSYTVTDTFTDGKTSVTTTKYGYVGNTTTEVGTAPTYEGYALKTDCTDAAITIGTTDADRLSLTRVYEKSSTKIFTYNGKDYYDTEATTVYEAGADIKAYWYESDGVLGFVGTGDMYDWGYNTTPWYSIKSNITDVYFADEITSIGSDAFSGCQSLSLTGTLPAMLTSIEKHAFNGCRNLALTGELPSGLTSIGDSAFVGCTNLALTGELPSGLTSIDDSAFCYCTNLALSGELPSGLTTIGKLTFDGCTNLALTGELPSGLTSIGSQAFNQCTNLALTGELPSGLTSIGNAAFYNCTSLALSGSLPSGLTSIGSQSFDQCTNLAITGELPNGLTSIGAGAFSDCTNLALTGELPSGLTSIGNDAFYNCTSLALTGELPSGLTSIGQATFYHCKNLALTGTLPAMLTTIEKYAFSGCTNLAITGELPSVLTSIGEYAFCNCNNLALTGTLPSGLTTIGEFAFYNCTNLSLAGNLPPLLTTIDYCSFKGVDPEKTHFDKNLSSVTITPSKYIPTSYTVIDTFTDSEKADVVTTKYGFVGASSVVGAAPTYEGYKLKTDCTDAAITIGATDADRLTLTREYTTIFTAFKFLDADDNYITTVYVPAGSEVTAPDAPEIAGKRFLRWVDEEGETLPEISTGEDKGFTYHPEYTVDSSDYTVYIYDGSYGQPINKKLLKTLNFDKPTEIMLENYFEESEPFDDGTYVRGYWNWTPYGEPLHKQNYEELHIGDKLMVDGPVELIVVYTNKRIDIKYLNDDDSLIWYYRAGQTSRLIYPETPKHSESPDKYTFDHWEDEYGNKYYPGKSELDYVSDSRTLKAVYAANKYNITFRDYDNSIFFSSDVPFGEKIEVPEPKREGYTFTGWSPVFSGICNGEAEYTAQYKKNPIMYTIRFVDYNDNLIASNIYKEGGSITIPASPIRDGYRFTGWTPNINSKAVASVTYKATYEKKEEVVTPTPTVPTTPSTPVTPVPTPPAPIDPISVPKPAEEVSEPEDRISESDLPVKTPERVPETVPEKLPELNIEDVPVPKPADIKEKAPVKPVKQETKEKQPLDNIPKKNPLEEIATPIIRGVAVTTLATGAIGVGLATTGGLSYWWLLLGCLLFKKKYPKILGIIPGSKRYLSHNNRPIKKKDIAMYYESFEDMAGKYSLAEAIDRMNAQNCYSVIEKSLQRIEIIADDKLFTIEKSEFENLDKILCDYINFTKVEVRFVYDDAEYSTVFI